MHIRWEEFMKTNDANCNILEQKQPNQVDLKTPFCILLLTVSVTIKFEFKVAKMKDFNHF